MTRASMLKHSLAAGLLIASAHGVFAQGNVPATGDRIATVSPVTVEDVQTFLTTPNVVLAQFPQGGPALQARIKALVEASAAAGAAQLDQVMATLQTLATTGQLSPGQVSALAQGATQAAATLSAAGNTEAQVAIQTAIAANSALGAAAQQAAAQQPGQMETASTEPVISVSPAGSDIGGGDAGGSSATAGGTGTTDATTGGGVSSGGGTVVGASGGGGRSDDDDDDDNETIDPSPVTRG